MLPIFDEDKSTECDSFDTSCSSSVLVVFVVLSESGGVDVTNPDWTVFQVNITLDRSDKGGVVGNASLLVPVSFFLNTFLPLLTDVIDGVFGS